MLRLVARTMHSIGLPRRERGFRLAGANARTQASQSRRLRLLLNSAITLLAGERMAL